MEESNSKKFQKYSNTKKILKERKETLKILDIYELKKSQKSQKKSQLCAPTLLGKLALINLPYFAVQLQECVCPANRVTFMGL